MRTPIEIDVRWPSRRRGCRFPVLRREHRHTRRSTGCSTCSTCRGASYPATLTVYDSARQRAVVMPPVRGGRPVWSSLTPVRSVHSDPIPAIPGGHPGLPGAARHDADHRRVPRAAAPAAILRGWVPDPAAAVVLVRGSIRLPAVLGVQRAVLPGRQHARRDSRAAAERDRGRDEGLRRRAGARTEPDDRIRLDAAIRRISRDGDGYVGRGPHAANDTRSIGSSWRRTRARLSPSSSRSPSSNPCAGSCAGSSTSTRPSRSTAIGA